MHEPAKAPARDYPRIFADMARDLLCEDSVQDVLDAIVRLAVHTLHGCEEAGILMVDRPGRTFSTAAATGELPRASDQAQFDCDEGPCLDAVRGEPTFRIDDMAREDRWPAYRPRAVAMGIGSMMGFELFTHDGTLGSLNMYATRTGAFDAASQETGWVFASHAAVAIASTEREATVRAGLETRHDIGAAVGILMERHRLSDAQALDVLKQASMQTNTKLRDVALRVTGAAAVPDPAPPGDDATGSADTPAGPAPAGSAEPA
ncbi:GAF and ANTAR domain-containing protein [Nocardiopsis sediminis]|uniref:GAF and ANTAR domain-containing protein n=1 Tax=Nocardiopsis sediminis TaxID=1778267 RepID=A0ABV8FMW2_9ACTN